VIAVRRARGGSERRGALHPGPIVSGFFGGLSGHQGAFRSVFLLRAGLDKEAFIGTGTAIASIIDVSRLAVYLSPAFLAHLDTNRSMVILATATAFAGAFVGSRLLEKITLRAIQVVVAVMLAGIAAGLGAGLL
jgi:uncharacterized membrane protein YfcA